MGRTTRRLVSVALALLVAAVAWLSLLHVAFAPREPIHLVGGVIPPKTKAMLAYQWRLREPGWDDRRPLAELRGANPEWDLMSRTFLVYSLANVALAVPSERGPSLAKMDRMIDETLALEAAGGMHYFLLDYSRGPRFLVEPQRSQFLDGEIALMLGLRRLVEERADYAEGQRARVAAMVARMQKSPVLSAESYPDECWTFCNTLALAAIKAEDALDGTDHGELFRRWVAVAKEKLVDSRTGLLVSSYRVDGAMRDGPEGSSLWMSVHALHLIDPAFARSQYELGKRELARSVLGFGYAREWPRARVGAADVDSGPIVPFLEISAGSSGLLLVAAAELGDEDTLRGLHSTLDFAAFPISSKGELRYAASNVMGDAVMLYSQVLGPAWDAIRARTKS